MNETYFQMKDIVKEVQRISQIQAKLNDNVSKIEELDSSKKSLDEKLTDQETRLDTIESNLNKQKKEHERQFEFLNSINNALFVDTLNPVEKELNQFILELKLMSNNDIYFSILATWSKQNGSLILVQLQVNLIRQLPNTKLDVFKKSKMNKFLLCEILINEQSK